MDNFDMDDRRSMGEISRLLATRVEALEEREIWRRQLEGK